MSTGQAIREQGPARLPGQGVVTLLAAALIFSPLLQWLHLTALSHFTLLEPPFTSSRGIALAMQLFFSPGNILAVALGVGLMRRSEWSRRIVRALSLFAGGVAALQLGVQVATWRFDSNALLAGTTLVFTAVYVWYLGRPHVKQQSSSYHAHDAGNTAKEGDVVEIAHTRRISKTKTWRLLRIVRRTAGGLVHTDADVPGTPKEA